MASPRPRVRSMGLFDKLKQGLQKTKQLLQTDIRDLFKTGEILTEEKLEQFFARLIRTDMGVPAARAIVDELRTKHMGRTVVLDEIWQTVKDKLKLLLKGDGQNTWDPNFPLAPLKLAATGPTVILVAGVNGVGKTTSIAKLANLLHKAGKKVVLAAGDTFRAAAVEQLTMWSRRIGCEIVTKPSGSDPAAVAYAGCVRALEMGADIVVVDTAGRLQTQQNLMKQLEKIRRVLGDRIPGAPHEVLLVLDATTGQNGVSQAQKFSESVACTGLVLAKLDGTAKGGVVVAIRGQMNLPVKYVGLGEQIDDLEVFNADQFVEALFSGE
jgi:fused signal recognition particle receptor